MKNFGSLLLLLALYSQISCNGVETKHDSSKDKSTSTGITNPDADQVFTTDWKTLTKDFNTWYNYTYYNVQLSQDFTGLGIDSAKIDKATFLDKLMTENVVAFKTKILHGQPVYQLFKLNSSNESIISVNRQMAAAAIKHFQMEGTDIPEFSFTDLKGNKYTRPSTKGKIMVLKCWFIHCGACVKEFPELNKLVDDTRGSNDVLFISLALDSGKDLQKFFETKEFKYETVPEMTDYINDKLNITAFPTHILVNRDGKIVKVTERIDDLVPFLKKEIGKTNP